MRQFYSFFGALQSEQRRVNLINRSKMRVSDVEKSKSTHPDACNRPFLHVFFDMFP